MKLFIDILTSAINSMIQWSNDTQDGRMVINCCKRQSHKKREHWERTAFQSNSYGPATPPIKSDGLWTCRNLVLSLLVGSWYQLKMKKRLTWYIYLVCVFIKPLNFNNIGVLVQKLRRDRRRQSISCDKKSVKYRRCVFWRYTLASVQNGSINIQSEGYWRKAKRVFREPRERTGFFNHLSWVLQPE